MDPLRFARVKALVLEVQHMVAAERAEYLSRACGDDAELRSEVESLLAQRTRDPVRTEGLDEAKKLALSRRSGDGARGRPPKRIGPYRVLGELGRGGMGVVYHARQHEPIRRDVALKLVRGSLASDAALERFEMERQVFALMDHPNIATILDAGSDNDGNPYYVMELVDGVSIREFCSRRECGRNEILEVFALICRAVQHAHQKGVVHRDLKPSNILMTDSEGVAVPKIIDFGIAKVFGEDAGPGPAMTLEGQVLGTLEYMSPEQARGEHLDTRTDIYSLGVILFELLTGELPHPVVDRPIPEAIRVIAEGRPRRLRETPKGRRCDGDLETILETALAPDPGHRYASAAALGEDIGRYLALQPIQARPPSTIYQLQKLMGRHRVAFGFSVFIAALLLVYGISVSALLQSQRRANERARLEAEKATQVSNFLSDVLSSVEPGERGRDVTINEVLDAAALDIEEKLSSQPEVHVEVAQTIAKAYLTLEKFEEAEKQLVRGLEVLDGLGEEGIPKKASLYLNLTSLAFFQGDLERAASYGAEAVEMNIRVHGEEATDTAVSLNNLAFILQRLNRLAEAEDLYRRALVSKREIHGEEHQEVAVTLNNLAHSIRRQGRFEEADRMFRESLALRVRIFEPGHLWIASTRADLASTARSLGRYEEAESLAREALTDLATGGNRVHAAGLSVLAGILADTGRLQEAESVQGRALALLEETFGEDHVLVARASAGMGVILRDLGRLDQAERHLLRAMEVEKRLSDPEHPDVGDVQTELGILYQGRGQPGRALSFLRESVVILTRAFPSGHWIRTKAELALARCLAEVGSEKEAQEVLAGTRLSGPWDSFAVRRSALAQSLVLARSRGWEDEAARIRKATRDPVPALVSN